MLSRFIPDMYSIEIVYKSQPKSAKLLSTYLYYKTSLLGV